MSFETLGLAPELTRALADVGYTVPTPIQAEAIPLVLAGHDLMGGAQTGTGKTAAFALPLLQRLAERGGRPAPRQVRALVLTPTRELATQVHDSARAYGRHQRVSSAVVFGGVGMQPQVQALARGLDLLVACPGRLIDHMQHRTVDLSKVEVLVLDEADRMLDMGFLPAMRRILSALPKQRQTLLFSATFADEIKALAAQFMLDPEQVQVAGTNRAAATVSHRVHPVDAARKKDLLVHLLHAEAGRQTLVFSRTKHGSDKLVRLLENAGVRAAAIHGNKSQNARTRALADFKSGRVEVLVATDIAARGLDIVQLPAVINFDLPMVAEDYVHRIGRTGRAGAEGLALSLVSHEDVSQLRAIQKVLKADIAIAPVEGFVPASPLRLDGPATSQRKPGGPQRRGGQPHHKPQQRHAHAGPQQRRSGNGSGRGRGRPAAQR